MGSIWKTRVPNRVERDLAPPVLLFELFTAFFMPSLRLAPPTGAKSHLAAEHFPSQDTAYHAIIYPLE